MLGDGFPSERAEVVVADDFVAGRKYAVRSFLAAEHVEQGWPAFLALDKALRSGAHQIGWGGRVGAWELRWASYSVPMDAWFVCLQVWPPSTT